MRFSAVLAVAVLGCLPSLAAASEENPFERGTKDRFSISLGGFLMNFDTDARLDHSSGLGTDIDLESDLALPSETNRARLEGYFRFAPRHRLDFGYWLYDRDNSRALDRQIVYGDVTFDVNAQVQSSINSQMIKTAYRYSYARGPRIEASVSGGLSTIRNQLELSGVGSVNGQSASFTSESKKVLAPIPMLGVQGEFKLAKQLYLRGSEEYFHISVSGIDGTVNDFRVSLDWYPFKNFGFGAGYNRLRIEAEDSEDATFQVKYHYQGLLVYATYVY